MPDEKQIAFIIAVNNESYFEECAYYIRRLCVPDGYTIDIIAVREAPSMCAAYNAGMQSSNAKYKVYLHQDVFIREPEFIGHLIHCFMQDETIGMIGLIGGRAMSKTGVAYRAWDVGKVDCREPDMAYWLSYTQETAFVEAVDGLLLATQTDIPWREDLFCHFDFYDVSQSFEMRKAGYRIFVPQQEKPWAIHDSGFAKLAHYDEARKICLQEYPEYFHAEGGFPFLYDAEWNELSSELETRMKELLAEDCWQQAGKLLASYRKAGRKSSGLERIGALYDIFEKEQHYAVKHGFFEGLSSYEDIYGKYRSVRFLLRRLELGMEPETYMDLTEQIQTGRLSYAAVEELLIHAVIDRSRVTDKLLEWYEEAGMRKEWEDCRRFAQMIRSRPFPVVHTNPAAPGLGK